MDRQTDLSILGDAAIFRALSEDVLDEARASAFRKRVAKGEVLFHQDDPVSSFYIVVVGLLKVSQATPAGAQVIIRYLGPREIAGYVALSGASTSPGTVAAVEDTHLIGWTRATIQHLMAKHPQIAMNAIDILGTRYQEIQLRLREIATESVERRIAHVIQRLAAQAGRRTSQGVEIAVPLSRQDLAEMTGTTLHTVSRTLSAWGERGIVYSGRRRVVICEPEALSAIAENT